MSLSGDLTPRQAADKEGDQTEKLRTIQRKLIKGYEKLAFGSVSDAVRLLFFSEADPELLDQLDLFNIAEIKRLKEGGMEIKFFDRLKAMEYLGELGRSGGEGQEPFYRALEQGVKVFDEGGGEHGA